MKILVVDDEVSLNEVLRDYLESHGHECVAAHNGSEAEARVRNESFDAMLLDVILPDMHGTKLLERLLRLQPGLGTVVISGQAELRDAVDSMRGGAEDYLTKPLDLEELLQILKRVEERSQLRRRVDASRQSQWQQEQAEYLRLPDKGMEEIYRQIGEVASLPEVTTLLLGETGTGKEHVARLIHQNSAVSAGPFVEVHCGALPESLLESELFGYEAGAFTDARKPKAGLFETAQRGSIFLDEVGEMPPTTQVKLLKVLEEKKARRLGGIRESHLNLRIIAATNRNLRAEVERGRFRADLYYRLCVFVIHLPALCHRPRDIQALTEHFYKEACRRMERPAPPLGPKDLRLLEQQRWPGNVRELKNLIERYVISSGRIGIAELLKAEALAPEAAAEARTSQEARLSPLELAERQAIVSTMESAKGNRSEAARRLRITRKTLLSKLRGYGLALADDESPG